MKNRLDEQRYLRAKDRVNETRNFYSSLIITVFVISLLAGINYYLDQWAYPWFLWAAFGFGIGLIFKAIRAFKMIPYFGKDWEQRKIREFMQEDKY